MPSKKISELDDAAALAGTELVPVVQSGGTKKATVGAFVGNALVEDVARAQSLDQLEPPAGNVHWNSQRITNLGDPLDAADAALSKSTNSWVRDLNAWTRTSNTTFTQAADTTAYMTRGTKLRWTESSAVKFGVVASAVHAAGTTTVTLMPTSDYVMAASPDGGSPRYSYGKPFDFPNSFAWSPAVSGFSAAPTHLVCWWAVNNGVCEVSYNIFANGTSNSTSYTVTAPISCGVGRGAVQTAVATDNGVATMAQVSITGGSTNISVLKAPGGTAWTASGAKGAAFSFRFPI